MKKIKTDFGSIEFINTKKATIGIEKINPNKSIKCYLKKSMGIVVVLEGQAKSNKGIMKKDMIFKFKPREKIIINNIYKKPFIYLAIDIPPVKENEVVWLKK